MMTDSKRIRWCRRVRTFSIINVAFCTLQIGWNLFNGNKGLVFVNIAALALSVLATIFLTLTIDNEEKR